jgi:predicted AlkP superfamily pyrophosphatase or phosphodiesterase
MPPVVFIMLDGVRPDAIETANCPTLNAFREHGASTMRAHSVLPSITLPCHMSIFHSVPPTRHGITSNTFTPMARPLPGLVEIARAVDKRIAFFYNWEQLRDLARPGGIHYAFFRDSSYFMDGDDEITAHASQFIQKEIPELAFLYMGTVDSAGHQNGWMSDAYLRQLEHVDALLNGFLGNLPGEYTVIIHSDHGGHDRIHGTDSDEDMIIPWMAAGAGIKKGYAIQSQVSLLDTAPTIAKLLGIKTHHEWEGHAVEEIFM